MKSHKVLILGVTGMLGHKIYEELSKSESCTGTIRGDPEDLKKHPVLRNFSLIGGIVTEKIETIEKVLDSCEPDVVINCIGVVKQLPEAQNAIYTIGINSLFPHQLANLCSERSIRCIHYSTDCVFSGKKGLYTEEDIPDPVDLYGRSKLLGEISYDLSITIRTSIIGRELSKPHGLLEWFLSQKGLSVKGYKYAIFSGLTTTMHAKIAKEIIHNHPNLHGLYHVAADPISKFDLLKLFNIYYHTNTDIIPDYSLKCDRSLDGSKFRDKTRITIPSWEDMIKEISSEDIN